MTGSTSKIDAILGNKIHAIDLFCGAGGLTHGLYKRGIKVNLGIDIDPACKYPYEANNKAEFWQESVENINADKLKKYLHKAPYTLLAGCAPCQPFSAYRSKLNTDDSRWYLLDHFSRLINELKPDFITMENVPRLRHQKVYEKFIKNIEKHGYKYTDPVINCADYGLPQKRKRLVVLASKYGDIEFISPIEFGRRKQNVRSAIGKLKAINDGGDLTLSDNLHFSAALSEINKKRMKHAKPGGTWKDFPEELIAPCHKKSSGAQFTSAYSRMTWDDAAPTITTYFTGFNNGRFGHPDEKQLRAISIREGAILQGFPQKYKLLDPNGYVSRVTLARMIGNAVPVTLGEVIASSIINHLKKYE